MTLKWKKCDWFMDNLKSKIKLVSIDISLWQFGNRKYYVLVQNKKSLLYYDKRHLKNSCSNWVVEYKTGL